MDSKKLGRSLLGKNEKIIFDPVLGAIYYWRLSDREVILGMTTAPTTTSPPSAMRSSNSRDAGGCFEWAPNRRRVADG